MEYSVVFQYMYVVFNDLIRVIGISLQTFIITLCWEHIKSSVLPILKYKIK
jgi:hypothetical protein